MPKYTNFKMEKMLNDLKPVLQHKGKVGYVAARNTRVLRDVLTEYFQFRDDLIRNYGKEDDNGRITIAPEDETFSVFTEELNKIGTIEHEVEIMSLKYDEVMDVLSGQRMLNLEWMLED